jgi:hypothetical protein
MRPTKLKTAERNGVRRVLTHLGEFTLVPAATRPGVFYPLNARLEHCRVSGYRYFVERDGELRGVR